MLFRDATEVFFFVLDILEAFGIPEDMLFDKIDQKISSDKMNELFSMTSRAQEVQAHRR